MAPPAGESMSENPPQDLELKRYLIPFRSRRLPLYRFDVVVLGSGVAGSSAALAAAQEGAEVALVAKDTLEETNTFYAQGGVAAVLGPDDSVDEHVADTLRVGCHLCDEDVVRLVVEEGPAAIGELIDRGADFDRDAQGQLDLSREGGHSRARIAHAHGAATGLEIQRTLCRCTRESPLIASFERTFAIDLLSDGDGRVAGVLCQNSAGALVVYGARQVVLATGGAGQIYRETTNPAIATGDGVAMAFRAGARVRDLEFVQFHPTCLYIAGAARFLISEIVRGAGGVLRDKAGVRFMPEYHPAAELAPRDVVSRACFDRMVSTGDTNVYLDLSDLERDPHELFPHISRICRVFSIDIARDPIPVRPGAHYMIGGVRADLEGRTDLAGLWAVGECASSGLHGANRMGSNSLLEGLVLGRRAGASAAREGRGESAPAVAAEDGLAPVDDAGLKLSIEDMTYSLKALMWRQLGIVRRGPTIAEAIGRLDFWRGAVERLAPPEARAWELANMLSVARLVALSAHQRQESRGTHFRADFPAESDDWRVHTLLTPQLEGGRVRAVQISSEPVHAAPAGERGAAAVVSGAGRGARR